MTTAAATSAQLERTVFKSLFSWVKPSLLSLVLLLLAGSQLACETKRETSSSRAKRAKIEAAPLRVGKFSLVDQHGTKRDESIFQASPAVVVFMFTRCPTVCPKLTRTMVKLRAQAEADELPLQFISISVDPEYDQPAVLEAYAKTYGADRAYPKMPEWLFLSGKHESIAEISEKGFRMGLSGTIDESKPHLGITHGSHFILVDQQGLIQDFYRSSEPERLAELLTDAEKLFK